MSLDLFECDQPILLAEVPGGDSACWDGDNAIPSEQLSALADALQENVHVASIS